MNETSLYINNNVDTDLADLLEDISSLEEVLNKTMEAINKLDEKVWKSKEKDEINKTFIPFLKKYNEKYPNFLRKRIEIIKTEGIQSHENVENDINDISNSML